MIVKYEAPYELKKAHKTDAAFDVQSVQKLTIPSGSFAKVDLGLVLEIPEGYEVELVGRSGLASKGIYCHYGTIDAGYRGIVSVILFNISGKDFKVNVGDRVGQIKFRKIIDVDLVNSNVNYITDRGTNGFGSSGTGEMFIG